MMSNHWRWVWLAAFTAGCLYFIAFVERSSFVELSLVFGFLFVLYGWAVYHSSRFRLREVLVFALFVRLLFFLGMPQLSDDYHRFLWDGQLVLEGVNPYLHLPSDYHENQNEDYPGIGYYAEMNSLEYYSVYPPLKQAIFALSAQVAEGDPGRGVVALRVILLLSELLFLWAAARLLMLFNLPVGRLVIYAFHPLVIIEVMGNVHFEGMVLLFLALSLLAAKLSGLVGDHPKRGRLLLFVSGIFFGCAVLIKLTPLLLGPLIMVLLRRSSRMVTFALGALSVVFLATLAFWDAELPAHFRASLGLYFRTFEFNASIYYLTRAIGHAWLGYNAIAVIGPALSLISTVIIIALALRLGFSRIISAPKAFSVALFSWSVYLLFATTVHPWYLIIPVGLIMFFRHWAVLIYTCTVVLSYSHYRDGAFDENFFLIAMGYAIPVFVAILLAWNRRVARQG